MITRADTSADPSARPAPAPAPATAEEALERARAGTADDWRAWAPEVLAPVVRVALLRAETARDPRTLDREDRGEALYQAVRGIGPHEADRLPDLVEALAGTEDAVLEGEALRLARAGLHAQVLTPRFVRGALTGLLASRTESVVAGALEELAEPWAACTPVREPETRLLRSPATAAPALALAAAHGHGTFLFRAAADRGLPPAPRQRALELLGETAGRGDVPALLDLAADDPLLFAAPAVACLRALHRRGHFVAASGVPAVLGLALADHRTSARTVATILWTTRHTVLRLLLAAPPDDPSWPRRLDLLVALAAQGDAELPIGASIARLLPGTPAPGPFLRALRALRDPGTEDAVLAALPAAAGPALSALETVGGARTVQVLARGLGIAPDATTTDASAHDDPHPSPPHAAPPATATTARATAPAEPTALDAPPTPHATPPTAPAADLAVTVAPALRAQRGPALELLWLLAADPHLRQRILARLDPLRLPPRIAADLGAPDAHELAVLTSHLDPAEPVDALTRLAAHGGPDGLPVLADLLLRVAGACVEARAAGHEPPGARQSGALHTAPETPGARDATRTADPEPTVPRAALDALTGLGRRLYGRGRIRPLCLLDASDATSAGHALAADLALGLVERPGVTAPEQAVLLRMVRDLPDAPPGPVRARVHRLLRHPDRHVRKHAVALLARDGDGVEALSAGLVALTGPAGDPQTVRATAAALGDARARWASGALADCLTHPAMEVRKTAAAALARAGTPRAVPALLHRLGRDDNPGLRALLVAALQGLLGDACAATVRAAAEHESAGPVRDRLLAALPAAPEPADADLALLAAHGWDPEPALRLAHRAAATATATAWQHPGPPTRPDLGPCTGPATRTRPDPAPRTGPVAAPDTERDTGPFAEPTAEPTAGTDTCPRRLRERLRPLRAHLVDWLDLAGTSTEARRAVLPLLPALCPEPRAPHERASLARSVPVLLEGLAEASGEARDDLLSLLEDAASRMRPPLAASVVTAVRSAPTRPAGRRSALPLLRACGAVVGRFDLDRELAAAALTTDPDAARERLLGEAFGAGAGAGADPQTPPHDAASPPDSAHRAMRERQWQDGLAAAARDIGDLTAYRAAHPFPGGSRAQLAALAAAQSGAPPAVRAALLDWMTDLQPPCAPAWTLAETARTPAPPARTERAEDLDQPRSAAQRARLLTLLASDDRARRSQAAARLLDWPEPDVRRAVLDAYLHGRADLPDPTPLHTALAAAGPPRPTPPPAPAERTPAESAPAERTPAESAPATTPSGATTPARPPEEPRPQRLALLAAGLVATDPGTHQRFLPLLLHLWESGPADAQRHAAHGLRNIPADTLAAHLEPRLTAGATGLLGLLAGQPLLRTPALTRLRTLHPDAGLLLTDGPLRGPDAAERDAAALRTLRERAAPAEALRPPTRDELFSQARSGEPKRVRRALTLLTESPAGSTPQQLAGLLAELLTHPSAGVRLHAHRVSRTLLDRRTHLDLTELLLDDPQPDVVRRAVRVLAQARRPSAAPRLVSLLDHGHETVRRAAGLALVSLGPAAVPALRHAAARARPDRRDRYRDLLARASAPPPEPAPPPGDPA
ncbi:HEAT repeat domain-containing protein [Streptomyces genisteinicus]|uniref:HEAT repeat domain-containing protein n=1 Tax=Streptomyces genisteinicus TaxID=2768068 RepID=A0A7H0I4U0_9ACTN|nr:HEAT repeat domain-containing protein [Streptomyces genisteinicus]QNP67806.1 HEAT repeat domain-containing protein [Streptomyces genisteinicus]